MISSEDFFNQLANQFEKQLPFVAYRKPSNGKSETPELMKALLQRDAAVYKTENFEESGFVFAPFDSQIKANLIPQSQSQMVVARYSEKNMAINIEVDEYDEEKGKEEYLSLVQKAKKQIENNIFKKVVISRQDEICFKEAIKTEVIPIFNKLLNTYYEAFVYIWFHPKIGVWLGATPEVLMNVERNKFNTMALAGTQKTTDLELDKVNWGEKEKEEQQIVTDAIFADLESLKIVEEIQKSKPYTSKAGNLLHLRTDISGTLKTSDSGSVLMELIKAIHPTPAVCGLPKESAKKFILENEDSGREFYAGFLGELNIKTEKPRNTNPKNQENSAFKSVSCSSSLYVNLRCMKLKDNTAQLFIGGGITASSNPEDEWNETRQKAETMKSVLLK